MATASTNTHLTSSKVTLSKILTSKLHPQYVMDGIVEGALESKCTQTPVKVNGMQVLELRK